MKYRWRSLVLRLLFGVGHRFSAGGREFCQHLARGIFAVADAGHQVVGTAESVVAGGSLQVGIFDFFQRDAYLRASFSISFLPISMARSRW